MDFTNIQINYNTNYKFTNFIKNHGTTIVFTTINYELKDCLPQYLTSLIVFLINPNILGTFDTFNDLENKFLADFLTYEETDTITATTTTIDPDKYYNLKKIIEGRKNFDKDYICSFIYTVYSEYLCCRDNTHLIADIPQRFFYLISALNNYNEMVVILNFHYISFKINLIEKFKLEKQEIIKMML